ncbi:MAG: alkaline phosphatase D family protein [Planctomycetes bacterium]|nr:alkaline phosphatase D family protein [Planctomycetota bacterium]
MHTLRLALFIGVIAITPFHAVADSAFPQGVASGDALPDRAICWTRTTSAGTVRIDVALDEAISQIVTTSNLVATPETGLSIKHDVTSLNSGSRYYFRFTRLDTGERSPVGTFVTAPATIDEHSFRFVYTGDSNAANQPFRLLGFAAEASPEFWILAGDTIYSDQAAGDLGIANDLSDYRAKYAQNRSDASLQQLSATAPVWVQWDDHEVTNDYDGGDPEPEITPQQISDAYQAFFENQPIRGQGAADDPRRTYRSFRHGSLAEFYVLDCRQYRSRDAGRDGGGLDPYGYILGPPDPAVIARLEDPTRTMLGAAQLAWLKQGLSTSTARWKFVLSSVTFTSLLILPYDRWDGYDAERYELLRYIDEQNIEGVVFLSADIHGNTYNPDIAYYLRNSLGQSFSPDFHVPEFVTGPVGQATIRQELSGVAGDYLQLPPILQICSFIPNLLIDLAQIQVIQRNSLAFLEPNRYAYLVVDVSPDSVTFTHKGIPADPTDSSTPIATLNSVTLPTPPLCGVMPINMLATLLVFCGPIKSSLTMRRLRRTALKRREARWYHSRSRSTANRCLPPGSV